MKLYYTTITGHLNENKDPRKSLGGYRSSTYIPNGRLGSLFTDITDFSIDNPKDEYIAICLFNETPVAQSVQLWFETGAENNPCYSKIELAAVSMPLSSGYPAMEFVRSNVERPYVGDFAEYTTDNKANIGTIASNTGIGLWIRRSLDLEAIRSDHEIFAILSDGSTNQYVQKQFSTSDLISLKIEYQPVI